MANEDILTQAASATQNMIPQQGSLTSFGPTPMQVPPPPVRFQPPQVQHAQGGNSFATVGERKRADKAALFHSISGLIKSGTDYINDKKQRVLTMDLQNLMEAQQGLQEAKMALQQNPNDPNAQEGLKRNTSIINAITSDPKKLKMLQKAFDIDLFGTKNGKNKLENQALVNAWSEFNKKKSQGDQTALNPNAQRFMQMQPWRQGLSPEAQAQAAAIKAGLIPKADEILKTNANVFRTFTQAKSAEDRTKAIDEAAKTRAGATDRATQGRIDAANIRTYGQIYAKEIEIRSQNYRAQLNAKTWDKRLSLVNEALGIKYKVAEDQIASKEKIANDKNKTDQERIAAKRDADKMRFQIDASKNIIGQAGKINDQIKTLTEANAKDQKELDAKGWGIFGSGGASNKDAQRMRTDILLRNSQIQGLRTQLDSINQVMNMSGINALASEPGNTQNNPVNAESDAADTNNPDNSDED